MHNEPDEDALVDVLDDLMSMQDDLAKVLDGSPDGPGTVMSWKVEDIEQLLKQMEPMNYTRMHWGTNEYATSGLIAAYVEVRNWYRFANAYGISEIRDVPRESVEKALGHLRQATREFADRFGLTAERDLEGYVAPLTPFGGAEQSFSKLPPDARRTHPDPSGRRAMRHQYVDELFQPLSDVTDHYVHATSKANAEVARQLKDIEALLGLGNKDATRSTPAKDQVHDQVRKTDETGKDESPQQGLDASRRQDPSTDERGR